MDDKLNVMVLGVKGKKIRELIKTLEKDLKEIDELSKGIKKEKIRISPQKNKQLLEEIIVPPLELLKDVPLKKGKKDN